MRAVSWAGRIVATVNNSRAASPVRFREMYRDITAFCLRFCLG